MSRKQKLELTWVGKENRPRLEPRILLEDPSKSYHAKTRHSEDDVFDNILVHGDNLLALKSLEDEFIGAVKCIYIDPPFNTQQAFDHYDDGLEHSIWLSLMKDRVELLHELLAQDGTLFVHIDDNEIAYLIALIDEIFGRNNRINIATFKQGAATGHKSINPGLVSNSNFILIYAKNKSCWKPRRLFTERLERDKRYGQFIVNAAAPFDDWRFCTLAQAFAEKKGLPERGLKKALGDEFEPAMTQFVHENPRSVIRMARPDYNAVSAAAREMIDKSKREPKKIFKLDRAELSTMYFVGGERILFYSDKLKEVDGNLVAGEPLTTIWDDLLSNNLHNEGGVDFPKGKKPEALLKRCIELSTEPGDLVLDSFGGSGTTAATAHKMRRRWITVELKEQAHTHILPRLRRVIDGSDPAGVSKAADWKGGGGFRYFELAPSLLEVDKWGREVISRDYNAEMLAKALCKLEGFIYEPSAETYWQHGHSSERDFIYVTTQTLGPEEVAALNDDVGDHRSLLVLCSAYRGDPEHWPNLTVRKIPNHIRSRCEWGHDDYSLNVANLPMAEKQPTVPVQQGLFDDEDAG